MKLGALVLLIVSPSLALAQAPEQTPPGQVPAFEVRPGYKVTLAAEDAGEGRFMELDDRATLYVSSPGAGEIIALRDEDADGFYETRGVFIRGKQSVHAMFWSGGWLWFATSGAVWKARDLNADGVQDELVQVTRDGELPQGGVHFWRSLLVTPDDFYTSIGDSGNITDEPDTDRQKIWKYNLDGSGKTLFCSGIRNTEKLRIRPGTNEIWGADHGSDNFGQRLGERTGRVQPVTDFNPPDEFNRYVEGGFYGHPFITGLRVPRYEFRDRRDLIDLAQKTTVPEWCFGAHWAVNSFCFVDPKVNQATHAFPADHEGDVFIACHGSWNRTERAGYQVMRLLFDKWTGKPCGIQPIVRTFVNGQVLARPVDCIQAPDGSILWSCDETHTIFRIRYIADQPR